MGTSLIDHVGGALLFPFFALYITFRYGVGLQEVGFLFTIYAVVSLPGSAVAGAMTDKFGRRQMIIAGLIISAAVNLALGFSPNLTTFYIMSAVAGLLSNIGHPAQSAMIADLLPEKQISEGFGIWRIVANLAVTIGPLLGGLLAEKGFILLFIADAVTSLIAAVIVYRHLPETKPERMEGKPAESFGQTLRGYKFVLRDRFFMVFLAVSMLATGVYIQMNTTLGVYLRDEHGISTSFYGYLMSMNAFLVVLFQLPITKWLGSRKPNLFMALGVLLYAIGFSMYGFTNSFELFLLAMVIITVGEMIHVPVASALVARLAPEDMRGRYMAMSGFSWTIPFAIAPVVMGWYMDTREPSGGWLYAGAFALLASLSFLAMHFFFQTRARRSASEPGEAIPDREETGAPAAVDN